MPDAAIATTAELGPAGGPGFRPAADLAASPGGDGDQLEPLSGRPGDRRRDPRLVDRRAWGCTWPSGNQPRLLELRRIALERLGPPVQRSGRCRHPQDAGRAAPGHGAVGRRGGPGGLIHGERGLAPGRTLLAETRRVELRDGRPPGALQLGAARAGVDSRGPQQDHHRAAADRDHPRQPRRDRPARQAGRARLQRRLHRQGRPDQRGRPPPGHGGQGLLGRHPERRSRRQARRRQVDTDLHRHPRTSAAPITSPTSSSNATTRTTDFTCRRPAPARSSRPIPWGCASWRGRRCFTG